MPLKDGSYKGPHWATRRALLDMLKTRGGLSSHEMAETLGVSSMAVRQHMQELEEAGDVSSKDRVEGRGRPTKIWSLTSAAQRHFPDRHRDLMLELLGNMQSVLGEEAMNRLLDERCAHQIAQYKASLSSCVSLEERVSKLAEIRSGEGYMAEMVELENGSLQFVENHCPICSAAESCSGLCSRELKVFQKSLGSQYTVERVEHILSGARRCAYRIVEKSA